MKIRMILLIGLLGLLLACTTKPVTKPLAPEAPEPAPVEVAKEGWEAVWEKTLQAAKKEGQVVAYASSRGGAILKEAAPSLKEKYGITIDYVAGRGPEHRARLFQERANKLYIPDILLLGLDSILGDIKPAGALDPLGPLLFLPEVVNSKKWFEGKLPFVDEEKMVIAYAAYPSIPLAINTELVKPEEIKSHYDLLNPKWKGKIIINDPTITGSPFGSFSASLYNKYLDLDFFRQLVSQQQAQLMRDQRLQTTWLAQGKYFILLWPQTVYVTEFQKAGAPVKAISGLKEGTHVSFAPLTVVNKRPHPNAAKIFVNWFLTREAQTMMQKILERQTTRVDVPTEGLEPHEIRQPGVRYFRSPDLDKEWVLKEQDRYLETAKQIFGPLAGR